MSGRPAVPSAQAAHELVSVQWAECGSSADHPAHSFQNGGPEDGDECRGWGALRVELELDTTAAATDDPPF